MSAVSHDLPSRGLRHPDRSLTGLLSDLWRESLALVRCETELAKAELARKVDEARTGLAALAMGGAVCFACFMVLLWAAVTALREAMPDRPLWMAPLIVGAVVLVIGLLMLAQGRNRLKADKLTPARTAASLRRDGEFAREHLR